MLDTKNNAFRPYTSYLILVIFLLLTLVVTLILYSNVQDLFKKSLQSRIVSIATTASNQFSAEELKNIIGPESVGTDTYKDVIRNLRNIRAKNENLKYIYILRRTNEPTNLKFVADADSVNPDAKIDLNEDGIVNESDALNTPGDDYDVSEFIHLQYEAFTKPTVDENLTVDQWGTFLSASAPIFNKNGFADEFIGVDVDVSDFTQLVNSAIIPFGLFLAFLLLVLTSQTVFLVRMWDSRVKYFSELDRQKDELLSLVSHQLATPVSSIKWYLEMLRDGDLGALTKEQSEHVSAMHGIGENMSDLVSMILDVSRIQLGRMKIEKQDLKLKDFFHELIATIEPKALEKKVAFIKNIPADFQSAKLDRRYTNMTIENLLSNAVKYTPAGGTVSFDVNIENKVMLVRVADTGMGIPKDEQNKIFGRMFRASNARNAIDGNGFGLFVAKGAVEAQGGKIWFESEVGKGTTFFVRLPLNG